MSYHFKLPGNKKHHLLNIIINISLLAEERIFMVSAISSGWKSPRSLPVVTSTGFFVQIKSTPQPLDFVDMCYKTIQQQSLDNQGSTVMLNPFALKGRTTLVNQHLPF